MKHWRVAGLSVLVAVMAGCCANRDDVPRPVDLSGLEEIRIDYEYSGWSWAEERFSIVPGATPGAFVRRDRYPESEGRPVHPEVEAPVAAEDVAALVQLATAPTWARDTAVEALAQRVDRKALRAFELMSVSPSLRCSDAQLQRLANLHLRGRPLRALVDDHYTGMWTDDYPSVLVQVRWRGRASVVMWSDSQKTLMLPWRMGAPSNTRDAAAENWSLPLSHAIRALLPAGSHAHRRLDERNAEERLRDSAMYRAERQCDVLRPRPRPDAAGH